jgi:hypothetical protein
MSEKQKLNEPRQLVLFFPVNINISILSAGWPLFHRRFTAVLPPFFRRSTATFLSFFEFLFTLLPFPLMLKQLEH